MAAKQPLVAAGDQKIDSFHTDRHTTRLTDTSLVAGVMRERSSSRAMDPHAVAMTCKETPAGRKRSHGVASYGNSRSLISTSPGCQCS